MDSICDSYVNSKEKNEHRSLVEYIYYIPTVAIYYNLAIILHLTGFLLVIILR